MNRRTTRTTNNWRRRFLFPLLAIGLATCVALIVAEVALRLFVDQEAKRLATYDETLGWRGRPHADGVYVRKIDNIRVPFHYNNLGFRDENVDVKAHAGHRLLILGDSFVENLEVEYKQTFPVLVEQQMQRRSQIWEVVVMGSQGYSTAQQLLAFRRYQGVVRPDIVLLCFYCGNDFDDNLRRRFAYLDDQGRLQWSPDQTPVWKHQVRRFQRWLYESSHLVFLIKNTLQATTKINFAPESKSTTAADDRYKQEITKQLITQMAAEVRATGAQFAVVVIPCRDDLASDNQDRPQLVTQFCNQQSIAALDLSVHLKTQDFFETDVHFNEAGHQKVAVAIDAFIDQNLVPLQ